MLLEEKVHKGITSLIDRCENDVAKWMLEKFLMDYPGNASGHYEKAVLAHAGGDSDSAGEHFKKAAELEPNNPLFLKILGDFCNVALNNSEEAIKIYEQVLSLQHDDQDTLLTTAHLYVSLKQFEKAKKLYKKVLEINPSQVEVQQIIEKLNALDVVQNNKASTQKLYDTACLQAQDGNKLAAVTTLEQILMEEPGHAQAHNDIGVLCYELEQKEKAFEHYNKAAMLEQDNIIYQKNLADFIWVERGDAEAAMSIYKKVLSIERKDVEALLGFARICLDTGRADDAKEFIECALAVEPLNHEAVNLLEQMEKGNASQHKSVDADALYERATSKAAAGDLKGAIEDLNRLVQHSPECAVAYNDLGVLYYQMGDQNQALEAYEKSLQLDPLDSNAMKNLADFYLLEQQRVEEAMTLYLKALEQNSADLECILAAGFICTLLKKNADAADFYRRVIELDPLNQKANEALSKLQGQEQEAAVINKVG